MKIGIVFLCCIFALFLPNSQVSCESQLETPIVHLKNQAQLQGLVQQFENQTAYFYEGIPYGKARRFSKPKPVEPWTGVYNATVPRFLCPQLLTGKPNPLDLGYRLNSHQISEDCLFLNLWRPAVESKIPRAVFVYLHGAGFTSGTIFTPYYDSRYLSILGDIIVVTVNYRLGPFGYLYGGSEDAPGNLALYDAILALKWVQENVEQFGGDPSRVTLGGGSSGSMSTGALVLSPLAKGLFQRAILQTGAPNSLWASESREKALADTVALGNRFNCSASTVIDCLRNQTVDAILQAASHDFALFSGHQFIPVYGEGSLLPVRPVEALKSGQFNRDIDLLFGVTKDEGVVFGSAFLAQIDPTNKKLNSLGAMNAAINSIFQMFGFSYSHEVADFYTKNLTNSSSVDDLRQTVFHAIADDGLICPTIFFGEQFSKHASPSHHVYTYRMVQPSALTFLDCHPGMGACHALEVIYVFGVPLWYKEVAFSEQERQLSRDMIHAWSNFVKNGKPGKLGSVEWIEAASHSEYMNLDPTNYGMVPGLVFQQTCDAFWKAKIFV